MSKLPEQFAAVRFAAFWSCDVVNIPSYLTLVYEAKELNWAPIVRNNRRVGMIGNRRDHIA